MKTDKRNISNSLNVRAINACAKPCIEPGDVMDENFVPFPFEPLPIAEGFNKKQFQQFLNACAKTCAKPSEKFEPLPGITEESGKLPVKETHPFKFVLYTTDKIVSNRAKLLDKITPGRKTVRVEFPSGVRRRFYVYPAGDICEFWKYFLVYLTNSPSQASKAYYGKSIEDHILFILKWGQTWSEDIDRRTWETSVRRVWYYHKIATKYNDWTTC